MTLRGGRMVHKRQDRNIQTPKMLRFSIPGLAWPVIKNGPSGLNLVTRFIDTVQEDHSLTVVAPIGAGL
jgi:hypothetical protein